MTLHERLRIKCLMIGDLYNYLEWRGHKVERTKLTRVLQETRKETDEVMKIIEEWISNPVNPAIYKTK